MGKRIKAVKKRRTKIILLRKFIPLEDIHMLDSFSHCYDLVELCKADTVWTVRGMLWLITINLYNLYINKKTLLKTAVAFAAINIILLLYFH